MISVAKIRNPAPRRRFREKFGNCIGSVTSIVLAEVFSMGATTPFRRSFRVQVSPWLAVALVGFGTIAIVKGQPQTPSTVPSKANEPVGIANAKLQFDKDRLLIKVFLDNLKDPSPLKGPADDPEEYSAYNELVLHAHKFAAEDLQSAARRDVSYGDLFAKTRRDYRFELIQFTGRLKRLRKIEANEYLKENGVKELYEAWVIPNNDNNPMCLVLTEKPEGIEPNLEYNPSYPVTATGYFFKLFEYQSKEPSEKNKGGFLTRRAPLLMGKTLVVRPIEDNDGGGPWREAFLPALLTFLGLFTVFALGVTWYFRRGDRRSIKILESKKATPFEVGSEIPNEPEPKDAPG